MPVMFLSSDKTPPDSTAHDIGKHIQLSGQTPFNLRTILDQARSLPASTPPIRHSINTKTTRATRLLILSNQQLTLSMGITGPQIILRPAAIEDVGIVSGRHDVGFRWAVVGADADLWVRGMLLVDGCFVRARFRWIA
jgi:hypothetical protein